MVADVMQGASFRQMVARAGDDELLPLLGDGIYRLITRLDAEPPSGPTLKSLVIHAKSLREYLLDPETCRAVLRLLSEEETRDLCDSLGKSGVTSLDDICAASDSEIRQVLPSLLAFLGVPASETVSPGRAPSAAYMTTPGYPLFVHQRETLKNVVDALYNEPRRMVLHMPTGAGKTRTSMHLVARHLREQEPTVVVWLALSEELLEQAASEFERAWACLGSRPIQVYRYWGTRTLDLRSIHDGLIVAGLGKLHAASQSDSNLIPSLADAVSLTVMDEAHQAVARTYATMLNLLASKSPLAALLGLTATPGRTYSDVAADERLAQFFARKKVMLSTPGFDNPIRYLIEQQYLARPNFRRLEVTPAIESHSIESAEDPDLPNDVSVRLADDDGRNAAILRETEALMERHRRVIVFATTKPHATMLAAVMRSRGHEADAVTGETPAHERQAILQRYTSNDPSPIALFNYGVLTTGFDAPSTSAALIARPTKSLVLFSQMIGRALRGPRAGGNSSAEIVTVVDLSLPGFDDPANAFTNWEDVWQ